MISETTEEFWQLYAALPVEVQAQARQAYRLFNQNPLHPGLHYKRVSQRRPVFSARVGLHYRAVGLVDGGTIIWFWIGDHDAYDRLLRSI